MAMLAGPRRKQKVINLRAKNNAWSNDANKFGQRMLEKMGWSSGKGLGANENGIVEHVIAKYKNDEKGLGFEDKNDQWTKHEDDFNALLSNLSNASADEEKLHSGISLEVKSKKSKSRVHYHKFTRGKDLTRYSEKDLANIFGKKSLKQKTEVEEEIKETSKDNVKISEQIFTEKGSMEDYFKNKLAKFRGTSQILKDKTDIEDEDADYTFKGFSNNSDDNDATGIGFSFYTSNGSVIDKNTENGLVNIEITEEELKSKKLKKKKKKLQEDNDFFESNVSSTSNTNTIDNNIETNSIKKSKKKHKLEMLSEPGEVPIKKISEICDTEKQENEQNHDDNVPKKKKKKKKDKNIEI